MLVLLYCMDLTNIIEIGDKSADLDLDLKLEKYKSTSLLRRVSMPLYCIFSFLLLIKTRNGLTKLVQSSGLLLCCVVIFYLMLFNNCAF